MNRALLMKITKTIIAASLLSLSAGVLATPVLQVGIGGGSYDTVTDTVYTSDLAFTVYAYGTAGGNISEADLLSGEYFLSIAVTPKQTESTPSPDLGSFTISSDGGATSTTIDVTADMVFGTPPIESIAALQGSDPGDLSTHGIFETYFLEWDVDFVSDQRTTEYNVEDEPARTPDDNAAGTMLYDGFVVNTAGLDAGIGLHFDLYDITILDCLKKNGDLQQGCTVDDIDKDKFAPYSHDAEYTYTPPGEPPVPPTAIPEPGALALFGLGLVGMGAVRLRRRRRVIG